MQNALTREQKKVVVEVDKRLSKAGLTTYTAMEESHFKALVFANEAMELGKRLIAKMTQDEVTAKNPAPKESSDGYSGQHQTV